MSYIVDFTNVSTVGLESSPVADALAGLRANEARYFKNKYDHMFTTEPASSAKGKKTIAWVHKILKEERGIEIASPRSKSLSRLSTASAGPRSSTRAAWPINVLYTLADSGKRAVGFKLSDGMEVPEERSRTSSSARPEVEAGRNHPWLLLRDQGRVATRAIFHALRI